MFCGEYENVLFDVVCRSLWHWCTCDGHSSLS